jgi:hypothetical protein
MVLSKNLGVALSAEAAQQRGGAFDIGEEKSQSARREPHDHILA